LTEIPDDDTFRRNREASRMNFANDVLLRDEALSLQAHALRHHYAHHYEWCGVPVIRHPDDIVLLQEMIWSLRPSFVIETGIARGGGLILAASLMAMSGLEPRVLGLDLEIFPHATTAIQQSAHAEQIEVWQGDSASVDAAQLVSKFINHTAAKSPGLLILDSDHSKEHVLAELRGLARLLPEGSVVIVADTVIEDMHTGFYAERGWGPGNSPKSAIDDYLRDNQDFVRSSTWGRRGLITEIWDGVLVKCA